MTTRVLKYKCPNCGHGILLEDDPMDGQFTDFSDNVSMEDVLFFYYPCLECGDTCKGHDGEGQVH